MRSRGILPIGRRRRAACGRNWHAAAKGTRAHTTAVAAAARHGNRPPRSAQERTRRATLATGGAVTATGARPGRRAGLRPRATGPRAAPGAPAAGASRGRARPRGAGVAAVRVPPVSAGTCSVRASPVTPGVAMAPASPGRGRIEASRPQPPAEASVREPLAPAVTPTGPAGAGITGGCVCLSTHQRRQPSGRTCAPHAPPRALPACRGPMRRRPRRRTWPNRRTGARARTGRGSARAFARRRARLLPRPPPWSSRTSS